MNLHQWSNPSVLIGLLSVLVQAVVVVLGWRLGRVVRSRMLGWVLFLAFGFTFVLRFSLMLATLRSPESPAFGNIQDDVFRLLASVLLLVGLVYVERLYRTRSKIEAAWRDSEQRFSYFADNGPMVITIKDEAGRYVFVNKLFEKTFQKTSAEVLGKTPVEVWPGDDSRLLEEHDWQVFKANAPLDAHEFVPTPRRRQARVAGVQVSVHGCLGRAFCRQSGV